MLVPSSGQIKKSMLGSRSQTVFSVPRSWTDRWPSCWGSTAEEKKVNTHRENITSLILMFSQVWTEPIHQVKKRKRMSQEFKGIVRVWDLKVVL